MKQTTEEELLESILREVRRYRLVFIQVGAVHSPLRETLSRLGDTRSKPRDLLNLTEFTGTLIVIDDLETMEHDPQGELSQLRGRVSSYMDEGINFLLLSTFPKSRYKSVPGSSLLLDAHTTYLPVGDFGSNSDDSSGVWPACADGSSSVESVARLVFDELGAEIAASLEHIIFESFLTKESMLEHLSGRNIEALYGAGLLSRTGGAYAWAPQNRFNEIRRALADYLSATTSPQEELSAVFSELWSMERFLRLKIRTRLQDKHGDKWASKSLHEDLKRTILLRAQEDVYAGANSLNEVRDPLEWLTLGELLDVRKRSDDLGMEEVLWEKLKREVSPIRNRVSHMRLIRPEDLATVRSWRAILLKKVK